MDMDFEMGDAIEGAVDLQIDELPRGDDILQLGELEEPGEVAEDDHPKGEADDYDGREIVVPSKVHISGVDTLHTDDIRAYVKAYFGPVDKVEWIDDGSANLVFGNEHTAGDAITALSVIEITDVSALTLGESLPAKPFEGKPEISLHVRLSLKSDKKLAGASLRSRYYLLHPEHDPENRRNIQCEDRSKYRVRELDHWKSGIQLGSASGNDQIFDASMYDDAPRQRGAPHRLLLQNSANFYASVNRGKELFTSRVSERHRSASPRRENENEAHMDISDSFQNKNIAKLIKNRMPTVNSGKELFPIRATGKRCRLDQLEESIGSARLRDADLPKIVDLPRVQSDNVFSIRGTADQRRSDSNGIAIKGAASANARELFPDKLGTTNAAKKRLDSRSQRRQKAQDLFL
ncbi:hypothetical protein E4U54_007435 [Claviceps lovelessii]|nr:hypothetical protein E4U54_007435 [Claviceps lovelessii]